MSSVDDECNDSLINMAKSSKPREMSGTRRVAQTESEMRERDPVRRS